MFVPEAELRAHAKMTTKEVASIDALKFELGSHIYAIGGEYLPYAAFLKASQPGKPLFVFGQGAQNRGSVTLPRFQRMDWALKFEQNVLIFSDPTLHLAPNMSLGWCLGTQDHYVLPRLQKIVQKAREFLGIANRSILFYGSSAGGFTSLMLACRFPGSSALVNNPQTDVLKFRRGGVRQLLELGYGGLSLAQAREKFGKRMSFVEALRERRYIPRIYYLQNMLDEDHFQDQMMPLISELQGIAKEKQEVDLSTRLIIDLYSDAKALHNPVNFNKIKSCLDTISYWYDDVGSVDEMLAETQVGK